MRTVVFVAAAGAAAAAAGAAAAAAAGAAGAAGAAAGAAAAAEEEDEEVAGVGIGLSVLLTSNAGNSKVYPGNPGGRPERSDGNGIKFTVTNLLELS